MLFGSNMLPVLLGALAILSSLPVIHASSPVRGVEIDPQGYSLNPEHSLRPRDLPVGTCDKNTPCGNGACCSKTNICGYSKAFCGDGCQHNCDAKSECGPYAPANKQKCPLNVCCSEFGYCGSTTEFCVWKNTADPVYPACDTKYGGCGAVKRPSCGGATVGKRTIGYYESWSNTRKCQNVAPEDLNLQGFTHINFAFAFFDPKSFQITSMDSNAVSLYNRFTALKSKASGLQTWISVGGWSFTDPGATQTAFSDMTSSQSNRATFISGLKRFMSTYGFDGVDLDWEYPGADDRGGKAADGANLVALVKEMKAAFGGKYGISMTLPTSFWYLQHFDLPGVQPNVDWFNLMSYDLHGTWDAASKFVGPYIAPHTNITEIDLGLDLLWRAGVTPDKVVLGQGWYGRSFTLGSPGCNTPNGVCKFSGPAKAGPCSNAPGILDNQEINDIIKTKGLKPTWDHNAAVKWITWDSNQWVSYDDADTFEQKRAFANKRCLSGLMVWAMDQVNQGAPNGLGQAAGVTLSQQANANQLSANQQAGVTCRYADCGQKCPHGSNEVAESNGQPGQLSTSGGCPKDEYRPLCCDSGTLMGKCTWRGFRGAGLSCMGGCADGETEIATNKNSHTTKGDQTCNGGLQSYCCAGFKPAPSRNKIIQDGADTAKSSGEAALEQGALDVAAKAFCRVAVPALLAPIELAEDLIPIIGEIADIAEIAATPALIQLCIKGIEKEGKAEFKVFGKEHTLKIGDPTKAPESRPPQRTHTPPRTSTKTQSSCSKGARDLGKRVCGKPSTTETTASTTVYTTIIKTCTGGSLPQACMHYSSAISRNPRFGKVTCSEHVPDRRFMAQGQALKDWSTDHVQEWRRWMRRPANKCQRDEWPPQHFWQGDPGQIIRYNHQEENAAAGNIWGRFCDEDAPWRCEPGSEQIIDGARTITTRCKKLQTIKVMSMDFDMDDVPLAQLRTHGLAENECYPKMLVDDPGFALLNDDGYYTRDGHPLYPGWGSPPPANLINGRTPPFKRSLPDSEMANLAFDNGTFSQPPALEQIEARAAALHKEEEEQLMRMHARDMELMRNPLGYVDCRGDECATQITPLGRPMVTTSTATRTAPAAVDATATIKTVIIHAKPSGGIAP